MVDFFNNIYAIKGKNKFLNAIKYYSILRFIIRSLSNLVLPIYFSSTQDNPNFCLYPSNKKKKVIVSLTSFPARISRVWLVIETLLRQSQRPDQIILWLSLDQFNSKDNLPKRLLNLQKRGLEINLKPGDLRSHKKYYYALQEYPNDLLITVDDDILYRSDVIEKLIAGHNQFPDSIVANYVRLVKSEGKKILSYSEWGFVVDFLLPNVNSFFGSGGGALFPANIFPKQIMRDDIFMDICCHADDVWLNMLSRLNGVSVVRVNPNMKDLLPVINKKNVTLASVNLDGGNDVQIAAVREFCCEMIGKDPFESIISNNC